MPRRTAKKPPQRRCAIFWVASRVTPADLVPFRRPNPARVVFDLAVAISLFLSIPLIYAAWPHWITAILCILLMIRCFNSFAQLIHSSDHSGLFSSYWPNEIFGNLCSLFLGYTKTGHGATHHSHHIYLNTEKDPDRVFLGVADPRQDSAHKTLRLMVRDFLMMTAFRRLFQYAQPDKKTFDSTPWRRLSWSFVFRALRMQLPVAIVQSALLAWYWVILGPQYYFCFFIFPLFSLYTAQIRLRSFAEHAFDHDYTPDSPEKVWVSRSINATFLERLVIAPLGIPYHFEHHLFPTIPYYNLPKLHRELKNRGVAVPTAPGYLGFLMQRLRQENMGSKKRPATLSTIERSKAA